MLYRVDRRYVYNVTFGCCFLWLVAFVQAECDCPMLPARCQAEQLVIGNPGFVICDFADDIHKRPVARFSVHFNGVSWNGSTPESVPLSCQYVNSNIRNYSCHVDEVYSFNWNISWNITLQINSVSNKNSGSYYCFAEHLNETDQRRWKHIPCDSKPTGLSRTTHANKNIDVADSGYTSTQSVSSTEGPIKHKDSENSKISRVSGFTGFAVGMILASFIWYCGIAIKCKRFKWWTSRRFAINHEFLERLDLDKLREASPLRNQGQPDPQQQQQQQQQQRQQ